MGKMADWVKKNVKDGVDISEFEEMESEFSVDGISDKNKALEFIKKNDVLKKALDLHTNESIKNHDKKFESEKLPEITKKIRSEVENELNPELTEEQKALKEANKRIDAMELKEKQGEIKGNLRKAAKELGFPEDRAERFYIYGENAMSELEAEAEVFNTHVTNKVTAEIKTRYGDTPPPQKQTVDSEKVVDRDAYMQMSPQSQSDFVAKGGSVIDS